MCVSQNTYTNAEKLLEAADQLAQSGECKEEEIYQAARDLELRMQVNKYQGGFYSEGQLQEVFSLCVCVCVQAFIQRVEQRKLLLDLAVSFYTHTKEVVHLLCPASTSTPRHLLPRFCFLLHLLIYPDSSSSSCSDIWHLSK